MRVEPQTRWTPTPIRNVVDFYIGGGWGKEKPDPNHPEGGWVIRGTDIPNLVVGDVNTLPYRYHKVSNIRSRRLQEGDIVFEVSGGSKDQPVGRTLLITDDLRAKLGPNVICASFCKLIRPDSTCLEPRFLYYYLQHIYATREIMQFQVQSTGISNFKFEPFLDDQRIPLPPLETQRQIADILSAYDDLIENNTRRIQILEEMARTIYREWFVHFRYPGHESAPLVDSPIGPVPEGWETVPLKDVAAVNAKNVRKGDGLGDIHYINISSVSPGRIDEIEQLSFDDAPSRARRRVDHGDVIWSTVRPNRRSYALILNPPENLIVSTGFAVLSGETIPFSYLYETVTTDEFVAYLANNATGSAYPAVNTEVFENADILLPSRSLLLDFHDVVRPLYSLAENLRARNQTLSTTRDVLLPRLISGQISPTQAEQIAAD